MPIRSRLLSLVIILAGLSTTANTWAMGDFNPVKPKAKTATESTSEFPFDNQSIPSAPPEVEPEKPTTMPAAMWWNPNPRSVAWAIISAAATAPIRCKNRCSSPPFHA